MLRVFAILLLCGAAFASEYIDSAVDTQWFGDNFPTKLGFQAKRKS